MNFQTVKRSFLCSWGNISVEANDKGIVSVCFTNDNPSIVDSDNTNAKAERHVELAIRELKEYFCGDLTCFTVSVDLSWASLFVQKTFETLRTIPFGKVISYGDLAAAIGNPRAARAVGSAMSRNPLLIIVPCHRVIAGNGRIGGWSGPLGIKEKLQVLEGISLCVSGR